MNAQAVGIANGFWTTVVDGVSVTINGKNAFVGFISGLFPAIFAANSSVINGLRKVV